MAWVDITDIIREDIKTEGKLLEVGGNIQMLNSTGGDILGSAIRLQSTGGVSINSTNGLWITDTQANLAARAYGQNKILASTASYMTASQTVNLSEAISAQPHGVVLAWSAYSGGTTYNYDWFYQFIPKTHVQKHNGAGLGNVFATVGFGHLGAKYIYVYDTKITGNDANDDTGSGSSVNHNNAYWVLRYVVGV